MDVGRAQAIQDPITVMVGSRPLGGPLGIIARHLFIEIPGQGRWEMGPSGQGKWISTTRAHDPASFSTAGDTQRAIDAGRVTWRAMVVSESGLNRGIANYDMTYVGPHYNALSHNSNFAVRYVLREAGGENIPTGLAPGFPDYDDSE